MSAGLHHPEASLSYVYHNIDLPMLGPIYEMEATGVLIDVPRLRAVAEPINARLAELKESLYLLAGGEWGINNSQSDPKYRGSSWFIYDCLGLPPKLDRDGKPERSTDAAHLEPLRALHVGAEYLYQYRKLEKLRGTYVEKIPLVVQDRGNGPRLYCRINNCLVETGRLSFSKPVNLQNIPVRAGPEVPEFMIPFIKEIRQAFIAPPGKRIFKFDKASVEFRILVCLAQVDPGPGSIIDAINRGLDVHSYITCKRMHLEYLDLRYQPDKALVAQRDLTKNVVYGGAYGQGPQGLQQWLIANGVPCTLEQAEEIQRSIFDTMPGVSDWQAGTKAFCAQHGYVTTYFGRRIWYPDSQLTGYGKDRYKRVAALREAINSPIQGTAADELKIGNARIHQRLKLDRKQTLQILSVHDELVFEAPEDEIPYLEGMAKEEAESVVDWPLTLEIECKHAENWGACK